MQILTRNFEGHVARVDVEPDAGEVARVVLETLSDLRLVQRRGVVKLERVVELDAAVRLSPGREEGRYC